MAIQRAVPDHLTPVHWTRQKCRPRVFVSFRIRPSAFVKTPPDAALFMLLQERRSPRIERQASFTGQPGA
jgi:hypothetical protein